MQLYTRIYGVDSHAVLRHVDLSPRSILLRLDTPTEVGALGSIQTLEIQAPDGGERLKIRSRITRIWAEQSLDGPLLFEAFMLEFAQEEDTIGQVLTERINGLLDAQRISDMLDGLLVNNDDLPRRRSAEHLQGSLERLKLTSLLNLFAMERLSGVLKVKGSECASRERALFFDRGAIVDALGPEHNAMDVIRHASRLHCGEFLFEQRTIERRDRIGMSITCLLLELARLDDEAAHRSKQGQPPSSGDESRARRAGLF